MTILFKQTPEILFTPDLETLSFPISDQGHEYWEEKIIETSESVFNSISIEETKELYDLSEIELQTTLRNRIEQEFLKTVSNAESYDYSISDDVFIVKITSELATEMQGLLRQTLVDRATQVAEGMNELFDLNPDAAFEGKTRALEMSEEYLSHLNVDPDFSNSELIYWETYRDYFASELGSYLFDY